MSFKVDTIPTFDQQVKSIAKKYPSLKSDLSQFKRQLSEQPVQGAGGARKRLLQSSDGYFE